MPISEQLDPAFQMISAAADSVDARVVVTESTVSDLHQRTIELGAELEGVNTTLDSVLRRLDALEAAPAPEPTPEEPIPTEPDPEPEPTPPSAQQRVFPGGPAEPDPGSVVHLDSEELISVESGTRYVINQGAHVAQFHIGPGLNNVSIEGPGTAGSIMGYFTSQRLSQRVMIRDLDFDQLYAHLKDLTMHDCNIINRGAGIGNDGYALWASMFRDIDDESRVERHRYEDCIFVGDAPQHNGCIRIEDGHDIHFKNCHMDAPNHRGLRLHGYVQRALVESCHISMEPHNALGGVYAAAHEGQRGYTQQLQFLDCDITDSLQIDPDDPATQLNTSTIWVNGCRLYGFSDVPNINQPESDWV